MEGNELGEPKLGPVYTMDHEVEPWKMVFSHGPTYVVRFLEKQLTRSLGPSLGVNQEEEEELQSLVRRGPE